MKKICPIEESINKFKVGDLITTYNAGIHRITDIEKRFDGAGFEQSPLITYELVLRENGILPIFTRINKCDALHCDFADEFISKESNKLSLISKNYYKLAGIEYNNGWFTDIKPEINEHVLIYCHHIQPNVQHAYWNGEEWKQNEFDFIQKETHPCTIHNVVGWQPLPTGPLYPPQNNSDV